MIIKRIFIYLLLLVQYIAVLNGQVIRGNIADKEGKPIPFSTIFIVELTRGTTANIDGRFELQVPEGHYTLFIRALGYRTDIKEVDVEKEPVNINTILFEQVYKIEEVRVYSGQEDPAYGIMRKAIGLAPYYLNQVNHWNAEVYMKGSIDVLKIPKLFQRAMKDEEEKIEVGRNYLEESLNEITFNAPDKYDQRVISFNSSFPGESNVDVMGYIKSSFYEPTVEMAISPLAPNAFSHYKFTYEGVSFEGKYAINKIKVEPRRKSQQLFSGYLYIVDDYWNIHSADLTVELFIGPIRIKQLYSPVKEDAWLPVSYNLDVKASIIGIKVDVTYLSSVKYSEIEINSQITPPLALQETIEKYEEPEIAEPELAQDYKTAKKVEEILSKEEMTNRDMIRLARLMDKETKKEREKTDTSLQIVETTSYTIEDDAHKRDTAYWNSIRPIPLTESELLGYKAKDSVMLAQSDTASLADSTKKEKSRILEFAENLTSAKTFRSKDSSVVFRYDGLIGFDKLGFNTVDGWVYRQEFSIRKIFGPGREFGIYPDIGYAFNRHVVLWKIHNSLAYAPMKRGNFYFDFGKSSADFNPDHGIDRFLNSVSSLFFRYNFLRLYEEAFAKAGNRIDLSNGLVFGFSLNYAYRYHLENSTDYSFFFRNDRDYEENEPENPHLTKYPLDNQESFSIQLGLTFTPRYHYRIRDGVKRMVNSAFPTFNLQYRKGIPNAFGSRADFDYLETRIYQNKDLGMFADISWSVGSGVFITNSNVHFADFKQFNTQEIPVLMERPENVFMLLEYYQYATPEWFAEAHIKYNTPFLIIKLLPFFSERLWRETLYGNYLYTPDFKNYVELGYGLSDVYLIADAGIFVGFENWSYGRWGVKVSLNF
ncbi:MAG: carboxypeptidase-like regulatory domain-containing protein [Bacteroidales bacterium]|nr:MAG: carboxypeptidase-like regulatory domain-containing protein [Bacteroidales bacterium]